MQSGKRLLSRRYCGASALLPERLNFQSALELLAALVLLLALFWSIWLFGHTQALSITFPYPLDYGEAPLVDQSLRLLAGEPLYRPTLDSEPYTISNYPPLYVVAISPFVALWGPNFWGGRLLSALSALASGVFLALIVWRLRRDALAALVSVGLFWAFPFVVHWSGLLRIDLLALALSLGGLYVLVRAPEGWGGLLIGAFLLAAAAYTRQSYALAAPFAAFIWLWAERGPRRAFTLAALVGGLGGAVFLALNTATGGGFFFNIVTANVNDFGMERLRWNLEQFWDAAPWLTLLGASMLIGLPAARVKGWSVAAPYAVGATLTALTIGKIGSNVNYLLELCAALSLLAGMAVAWSRSAQPGKATRWLILPLLLALGWQALHMAALSESDYIPRTASRWDVLEELRALDAAVARIEGRVLADEYMGILTLQERALSLQPFEVTQLAWAGVWDQTAFVEQIRNGEFAAVLIHYFPTSDVYRERWTAEMLAAVEEAYKPVAEYADTRVYRPRNAPAAPVPEMCSGTAWRIPTRADLGLRWDGVALLFFGRGNPGQVPVVAAADGWLYRAADWQGSVAVLHEDPLQSGARVWSFYDDLASADGTTSTIASEFPPGSEGVPVKQGQVLGYQGVWNGGPGSMPVWQHLRFSIVRAEPDGSFPDVLTGTALLDPAPYLGIALRDDGAYRELQPLQCGR
ncbi:MAG: glycosyltransferase family 39 protein [Anaerolineae bacterium]|nr:glycosyltransferase family 39 protein [Anaerolineae bacterium]